MVEVMELEAVSTSPTPTLTLNLTPSLNLTTSWAAVQTMVSIVGVCCDSVFKFKPDRLCHIAGGASGVEDDLEPERRIQRESKALLKEAESEQSDALTLAAMRRSVSVWFITRLCS